MNLVRLAHVRDRLAAARVHLARHKSPRDVVFIDALPRNETGKVLRKKLIAH